MTLDQWICFDMLASEAKTLMLLRTLIDTQFQAFLRYGHLAQTGASAFCLQKLLSSLEHPPNATFTWFNRGRSAAVSGQQFNRDAPPFEPHNTATNNSF